MDYGQKSQTKKHKRREFLVDPARVELDEYMLAQIKKNKRSVKSLRKEVVSLRREVVKLQEQHDDYMLLEKTRTPDYSHSHPLKKPIGHNRISLLQQGRKSKHKLEGKSLGKDSSLLSISSSASSIASFKHTSKTKRNCNHPVPSSKSRLSKKIEELKSKALLQERERDKMKSEVKEKIKFQVRAKLSKQLAVPEDSRLKTPNSGRQKQQQEITEDYQKLLDLLKTSRSKQQNIDPKDPPRVSQFQPQSQIQQTQLRKTDPHNLQSAQTLNIHTEQKKGESQTFHSTNYLPFKSSTLLYQHEEHTQRVKEVEEVDEKIFKSQTNLLDSSPSRTPQDSPRRPRRNLQFSRAVDVCIATEQSSITEGSGNFQGLFGCAPIEIRSGAVEMSFEGGDNSKRRLRQLQFQFDQLVRQQLIASDPREKQMLGQTIRSVLWSINELKAKMSSKGSKDSG